MALLLNIETTTNVCSVALSKDGYLLPKGLEETVEQKSHASLLTVFIDTILKRYELSPKDLDAVSVSQGPGSYTGLRIGVSTAKGLAYSLGIPLIAICPLKAMARRISDIYPVSSNTYFCPMIDARRMEVYRAVYDINNNVVREIKAEIISPDSFSDFLKDRLIVFFGNGADKCRDIIRNPNAYFLDTVEASATYMIKPAEELFHEKQFVDVAYFEPFYLKDFIATVPKKKVLP